jgi:7-carboxy-7-deazaguanine synthase
VEAVLEGILARKNDNLVEKDSGEPEGGQVVEVRRFLNSILPLSNYNTLMSTELEASPQSKTAADTLTINEIFYSIQGESTFAGRPCVFVRLTGCDLRCTYCDTEYAFYEGKRRTLGEIVAEVEKYPCRLVEVTGGEPLLQKRVHTLMSRFCDDGYTVLIETSGAHDIAPIDARVHRIMDLKTPSSGECERNRMANLPLLGVRDEVKFVIGTEEDYAWAKAQVLAGVPGWADRVNAILFSPVFGRMTPLELATRVMADALPRVRMQLQMHKLIWEPNQRGV